MFKTLLAIFSAVIAVSGQAAEDAQVSARRELVHVGEWLPKLSSRTEVLPQVTYPTEELVHAGEWITIGTLDPKEGLYDLQRNGPKEDSWPSLNPLNPLGRTDLPTYLASLVQFSLGIMILMVIISVVLDTGKNILEKSGPLLDTLRMMGAAEEGVRWVLPAVLGGVGEGARSMPGSDTLTPLLGLARQAFAAFEKYQQLNEDEDKDEDEPKGLVDQAISALQGGGQAIAASQEEGGLVHQAFSAIEKLNQGGGGLINQAFSVLEKYQKLQQDDSRSSEEEKEETPFHS